MQTTPIQKLSTDELRQLSETALSTPEICVLRETGDSITGTLRGMGPTRVFEDPSGDTQTLPSFELILPNGQAAYLSASAMMLAEMPWFLGREITVVRTAETRGRAIVYKIFDQGEDAREFQDRLIRRRQIIEAECNLSRKDLEEYAPGVIKAINKGLLD